MKYIYALLVLLLALFLAAFIQQNGVGIQLRYFSWSTPHLPLSLYMILSFAAGYVLAVVVGFTSGLRFRFRASGAERELRQLRTELDQFKNKELEAVSEEIEEDLKASPSQENGNTPREPEEDDELSRHNHDPDAQTSIAESGGEEEK